MRIICPTCHSSQELASHEIHQEGRAVVTCKTCGGQILIEPPSTPPETGGFEFVTEESELRGYAGFRKRFAAALIDGFILTVVGFIIGVLARLGHGFPAGSSEGPSPWGNIFGIILGWLYFATMESSSKQGTLGKIALGIKVTDLSGNGISFGRATIRHFSKIISAVLLLVGYLMIAFTARKQGLHDMIAGCLVINRR